MNIFKGWKTRIVNGLASIIPILELTEVYDVIPDQYLVWYALGLVLVNMWLREVTNTKAGSQE